MATRPNYVDLPLVSRIECENAYHDVTNITEDMLCAGNMDGGKDECSVGKFNILIIFTFNYSKLSVVVKGICCVFKKNQLYYG